MSPGIKSYSPNLENMKLSLSKLMKGRNSLRTPGLGSKRGKLRLKTTPALSMKPTKLKPIFPLHQFTGQLPPLGH